MVEVLTGQLLVASPRLDDPNFARAVVLICSHKADGTFGLVLNRALTIPVTVAVPGWPVPLAPPSVLFSGGPVDASILFAIGHGDRVEPEALSLEVLAGIGLLDLTRIERAVESGVERSRVFAGYSGWGAGQLEAELAEGAWFVVDATAEDVFTAQSDGAWQVALRRRIGALAMYAFFPDDPQPE